MTTDTIRRSDLAALARDPLVRLVMASDGVTEAQFVAVLRRARPPQTPAMRRRAAAAAIFAWCLRARDAASGCNRHCGVRDTGWPFASWR
jgi:hypothetical protein